MGNFTGKLYFLGDAPDARGIGSGGERKNSAQDTTYSAVVCLFQLTVQMFLHIVAEMSPTRSSKMGEYAKFSVPTKILFGYIIFFFKHVQGSGEH